MTRKPIYEMFNEKGFKIGAEIGVNLGENALNMFKCIPGLKLYLIDPWRERSPKKRYQMAMKRIAPYIHNAIIMRRLSEGASRRIANGSLDFAYIDADHSYDAVMLDILLWNPKVKTGGIMSGHDYVITNKHGVKAAVDDYVKYHKIDLKVFEGNWYWEK